MSRPTRAQVNRTEGGFTLVEVLCALTIAALSLVVLLRGLGGSERAARHLEDQLGARLLAQSMLAAQGQGPDLGEGTTSGRAGKYRWAVTVLPAGGGLDRIAPKGWVLYRVSADVRWPPRGALRLDTVKLARR